MNMPHFYWGETVKFAGYLINRTPSRVLDFQTPQPKMQSLLSVPHLPEYLVVLFMITFQKVYELNLIHVPNAIFLLAILNFQKVIGAMIHKPKNYM
ncbi:hypothetical protein WN943_006556 [Citrus x changshan-huyou]